MSKKQLLRVRKRCLALPETTERDSHGAPTFFVHKKSYAVFVEKLHGDERIAVWLRAPEGMQAALIAADPKTFYRPPYVGPAGWIGIVLAEIGDEELSYHIELSWELAAPKRLLKERTKETPGDR